jgi:GTP-binding protein
MAFFDELHFYAKAGCGGDGVVRWRREKFIPKGGPDGGNGGKGGDVYIRGIKNIHILSKYRHEKEWVAQNGDDGAGGLRQGKYGDDLFIDLPIGSIVTNENTNEKYVLEEVGQEFLILNGGRGGFGNEHFKSSINTTPQKATDGEKGEDGNFHVELELFADVGLVGFPNAGKSSLLNSITNAEAKIGDYQFTTLEPNLGDFYGNVIADIPGIIEGASTGKGLGFKFLKHIKRTKKILHLISLEDKESIFERYSTIRKELENFGFDLKEKDEIILLTKSDLISKEDLSKIVKEFKKSNTNVFSISLYDNESIENFKKELSKLI